MGPGAVVEMRNSVFLAAGALAMSVGAVSAQWEPEQLPVYMPTTQHELEHYEPVADKASTVLSPMKGASLRDMLRCCRSVALAVAILLL